ncbi:hypothetical protein ACHAXR_002270, partial [Thalassiosira sp. AJA248-18]
MAISRRGVSWTRSESKLFSHRRIFVSGIGASPLVSPDTNDDDTSIHSCAVEASKDAMRNFHESLPPSLLAEKTKHAQDCVAPFKWTECELGSLLGSGEFSDVYKVKSFHIADNPFKPASREDSELSIEEMDQRLHMKKREKFRDTRRSRYALKHIKPTHLQTHEGREAYIQAASDLAMEKELLSSLNHPNIIKLRGITRTGPTGFALIIDRLVETLDQRMMRWRNPSRRERSGSDLTFMKRSLSNLSASFTRSKTKSEPKDEGIEILDSRISIVRGDAKIFDFGLARFCPEDGDPNIDVYKMSGAGSPRYMAPECLSHGAYNLKVDVYSFALVLWEMLSGFTPYMECRRKEDLINYVVEQHGRPDIDQSWPTTVQTMLKKSFDAEIGNRP